MRKPLTTYLFLLLLCGSITGQMAQSLESLDFSGHLLSTETPTITGQLSNYTKESFPDLTVRFTLSTPTFRRQEAVSADVNDDGTFSLSVSENYPYREVWISVGELYMGKMILNDGIHVRLDMAVLKMNPIKYLGEGVVFEGPDSELTTFVNRYETYKSEKKKDLQDEKLSLIVAQHISKADKVQKLKKLYKKWTSLEQSYSRKNGKHLQWYLTNDRIGGMYADIFTVHWGKKMDGLLYKECLNFSPSITSNATVQYYDFLGFYLGLPNRLEVKLLTERTLHEQLDATASSSSMDVFLREFNKKTDRLRYDEDLYNEGAEAFLYRYETELLGARMELQLKKMKELSATKAAWVMLLSQPEAISERKMYLKKAEKKSFPDWSISMIKADIEEDETSIQEMNDEIAARQVENPSLGIPGKLEGSYLSDAEDILSLVRNIRALYPGKSLILNLWVPWMDKCKTDLSSNKGIKNALDTLPVQMIYLCNSNDITEKNWSNAISTFPLTGDHILLDGKLSAEVMDLFRLRSFPAYIFVDEEGRVDPYFIKDMSSLRIPKLEKEVNQLAGI